MRSVVFLIPTLFAIWILFFSRMVARKVEKQNKVEVSQAAKASAPKPPAREVKKISTDPDAWQVIGKDGRVDVETQSEALAKFAASELDKVDPLPVPRPVREWQKKPPSEREVMETIKRKTPQYKQGAPAKQNPLGNYEEIIRKYEKQLNEALNSPGLWSYSKELKNRRVDVSRCGWCHRRITSGNHTTYKKYSGASSKPISTYCVDE